VLLRLVRTHIITFNLIELGRVGKGTTVIEIRPEAQINVAISNRVLCNGRKIEVKNFNLKISHRLRPVFHPHALRIEQKRNIQPLKTFKTDSKLSVF